MRSVFELDRTISSYDWYGVSARRVRDAIKEAGERGLLLNIHSPGGDVTEGLAMIGHMNKAGNVDTHVVGFAASMATIIAVSGKHRSMAEDALFMIHNPSTWAYGDAEDMSATADVLKTIAAQLAEIYARNSKGKMTKEEALALMDSVPTDVGKYLTAQEVLALGLTDEITKAEGRAPTDTAQSFSTIAQAHFQTQAPPAAQAEAAAPPSDPITTTLPNSEQMKGLYALVAARLSISAEATESEVMTALDKYVAAELAKQADKLNAEHATAMAAAVADAAVAVAQHAHILPEEKVESFRKIANKIDVAAALDILPEQPLFKAPQNDHTGKGTQAAGKEGTLTLAQMSAEHAKAQAAAANKA